MHGLLCRKLHSIASAGGMPELACSSAASLERLIEAGGNCSENLYERITRRKALEALGRRKSPQALPVLIQALHSEDEPAVVNAADAIARIGAPLEQSGITALIQALAGPDNQRRAVIQTHCRLEVNGAADAIAELSKDENPLVAGAALAYQARVLHQADAIQPLIKQLNDCNAGRRRAAVIDLGDARNATALEELSRCPVSMPLKAKSAFNILGDHAWDTSNTNNQELLQKLLQDDPRDLNLDMVDPAESSPEAITPRLQHRDEAQQYAGACGLLQMDQASSLSMIDQLRSTLGSDYGVHYLIANSIGLLGLKERADAVSEALHETGPQYAKSRIAAAWSCQRLKMIDKETATLKELADNSAWIALKWTCKKVLETT